MSVTCSCREQCQMMNSVTFCPYGTENFYRQRHIDEADSCRTISHDSARAVRTLHQGRWAEACPRTGPLDGVEHSPAPALWCCWPQWRWAKAPEHKESAGALLPASTVPGSCHWSKSDPVANKQELKFHQQGRQKKRGKPLNPTFVHFLSITKVSLATPLGCRVPE